MATQQLINADLLLESLLGLVKAAVIQAIDKDASLKKAISLIY